MGDVQFDVYVMSKCNSWTNVGCDFSAAFKKSSEALDRLISAGRPKAAAKSFLSEVADSCNVYSDCGTCLDDPTGACGWCDGVVTDSDGNTVCGSDGNGCCGGSSGFSQCDVAFRKTCPVLCDYTDWTNPACREATSKEINAGTSTYATCADMPWCSSTIYQFCDEDALQCKTVYTTEDCEANPDCDVDNAASCDSKSCQVQTYIYCDDTLGCQATTNKTQCDLHYPACDSTHPGATCDPTKCVAVVNTFYTCDATKFTCSIHEGPFPTDGTAYFNTTEECASACVSKDLTGVWRGLEINAGFTADEWDFKLGNSSISFKSKKTGVTTSGTYVIGDPILPATYASAEITVTLSSGTVLKGVVNNDRADTSSHGPVTKFVYLGLPTSAADSITSFDAGMASGKMEFVLVACLDNGIEVGCDFTSAFP
jgi:hypothetical protein